MMAETPALVRVRVLVDSIVGVEDPELGEMDMVSEIVG